MDGTLVYSKTPRGIAEISLRSAQLSMTARRVLIMIDGKRSSQRELAALKPADIVEVSIQKTGAPVTSSEGKAADGYISIVTRKAKSASRP